MQLNPQENVIVVPVELSNDSGSRVVDMALDTGASYVMIPWQIAEALGYDPAVSRRRINLTTASSLEVVPLITIRSVKVLGGEVQSVDAVCHDLPPGSRVQGLLGLSFLRHFDVDIHFRSRILRFRTE